MIPSPDAPGFDLGPLYIRFYFLFAVAAILSCGLWTWLRWRKSGGTWRTFERAAWFAAPGVVVGARIYHVATDAFIYANQPWYSVFAVWQGGYGIIGAIAGGAILATLALRKVQACAPAMLDAAVPGILLGEIWLRMGNYFNQELFGQPLSAWWAVQIDSIHRPSAYADFASFHPLFAYQIMVNIALVVVLTRLSFRRPGARFATYVLAASLARFGLEWLRIMPTWKLGPFHTNHLVTLALAGAALAWLAVARVKPCPIDPVNVERDRQFWARQRELRENTIRAVSTGQDG